MINGKKVIGITLRDVLAGVTERNVDTYNYLVEQELKMDKENFISIDDCVTTTFIKEQSRNLALNIFANMVNTVADIKDCPPILGVRQTLDKLSENYHVVVIADSEELTATKEWLIAYADMIKINAITTDTHINNYGLDYLVTAQKYFIDLFDPEQNEKTVLVTYKFNDGIKSDFYIQNLEELLDILS